MRNFDGMSINRVISIVNEHVSEIDYELRYIMCSLNSTAKYYLNTLGFLKYLQSKITRMKRKEEIEL